jgi:hypothetical protein
MATSYGTIPSSLTRRPSKSGAAMIGLLSLGVVALASVVIMVHSPSMFGPVVDLTKVSGKAAESVSLRSYVGSRYRTELNESVPVYWL